MAIRISGITLPNEKRVVIALTYIYGIGNNRTPPAGSTSSNPQIHGSKQRPLSNTIY